VVGVEPRLMGVGPVGASPQAFQKASLKIANMDAIEFNEVFSV